ncbi:hypothetical protein BCR43DRAFT_556274 [Syncephalastrum racemosum]|uniref:SEC7 domain-containing protein n=1 Tax=Syncephalastrum racemosum TaxID=13706 RepID=A0A1X2HQU6_SYNRA|nr:hypothetical protein BCR43DRAFT_556274 [Syncephalastrum racemosum]
MSQYMTIRSNDSPQTMRGPGDQQKRTRQQLNRPRSGSWGVQELDYFSDKRSHFVSKLAHRSPSSNAPLHFHPPPPPPIDLQPEQIASTPHPALANKPLPQLRSIPHSDSNTWQRKKRAGGGIKSLGRFFRNLGKHNSTTQNDTITTTAAATATVATTTTTAQSQFDAHQNSELLDEKHPDGHPVVPNSPTTPPSNSPLHDPLTKPVPALMRKHCTLDDLAATAAAAEQTAGTDPPLSPPMRRSISLDAPPLDRTVLSRLEEQDEDHEEEDPLDASVQKDSEIVNDRLSKRLSGGHYGSAGGLIMSTLSIPKDDDPQESKSASEGDTSVGSMGQKAETEVEPAAADVPPTTNELGTGYARDLAYAEDGIRPEDGEDEDEEEHDDRASELSDRSSLNSPSSGDMPTPPPTSSAHSSVADEADDATTFVDDPNDDEDDQTVDYAKRIWEQDDTVYTSMEHIAEWIGNGKPQSTRILTHYMQYYEFANLRLDEAFRRLCGKLHLKAETQQIDRILQAFAERYWQCNPHSLFGSADVVHAIVYSLLLLNTDLHVAQGDHKKMTRAAFVRNTLNAVRTECERDLDAYRTSTITFHSIDSSSLRRTPSCRSATSNGSLGGRYYGNSTSDIGNTSVGSKAWYSELESLLKEMYAGIRNRQILHPSSCDPRTSFSSAKRSRRRSLQVTGSRIGAFKRNVGTMWKARDSILMTESTPELHVLPTSPRSTTSTGSSTLARRRSISSLKSSFSQNSHLTQANSATTSYQAVAPLLHHSDLPQSYTSAAPYYKEGLIVRKHLLVQAGQKARHREWRECFLVVDRGEVRMYRLDGGHHHHHHDRKSIVRNSMMVSHSSLAEALTRPMGDHTQALGGGDWLANAQAIGEIDLKHTLCNPLPSGYSRQRPHAFALQQPNGGVYLFQVGSAEQVVEWVMTCNYWAARESKEPLTGGVGSMEYGWGPCLDHVDEDDPDKTYPPVHVYEWQPPAPPTVSSATEEKAQLDALRKHVQELNEALDNHRDLKRKLELRFAAKSSQGVRAMANWENKSQYLLHEIIKYQNYCDAIDRSLTLQDKALREEREKKESQ